MQSILSGKPKLDRALGILVVYLVAWAIVSSATSAVAFLKERNYQTKSAQHWVEYISVTPTKKVYSVNETPQFVSHMIVHKQASLIWNDRMQCDYNGDGKYGAHARELDSARTRVNGEYVTAPWSFHPEGWFAPPSGTSCHMIHEIQVCPDDSVNYIPPCKAQILEGEDFIFE